MQLNGQAHLQFPQASAVSKIAKELAQPNLEKKSNETPTKAHT